MAKPVKIPPVTTIDFETFGIESRPAYPPVPVGVSIKRWRKKSKYWAWGHPSGNNCTKEQALAELKKVWDGPILFHNSKFDVDVAVTHLGLPEPKWEQTHDTVFLLYLHDPHGRSYQLKPIAQKLLGMPPEERDTVAEWLIKNQPVEGIRIKLSNTGKYIAYAPGEVAAPYAAGDTDRTEAIFELLYPRIVEREMLPAYERERKLMPCLLDMERRGVPVDVERLGRDVVMYRDVRVKLEAWIIKRIGATPGLNLDADRDVLDALAATNLVDLDRMSRTEPTKSFPAGQISMGKKSLEAGILDRQLGRALLYLSQLKTCLGTFLEPWLDTARSSGGLIFTNWNQTRGQTKGGTRSGRLSSSDTNFQNIPKEFEPLFKHDADRITSIEERRAFLVTKPPASPIRNLPPLPLCRSYVVPMPGHVLVDRDYSQQEPRILAHLEGGALKRAYLNNPWIDFHDNARDELEKRFNRKYKRKPVKNINFGIIYGQGVSSLAEKNEESYEETKKLRDAIYVLYPGLGDMYRAMKAIAAAGQSFRTWGGREYFCETPLISKGRIITFDYKMINTRIQGSAADCTKEAVIRFYETKKPGWFLLLQVHDQLAASVPAADVVVAHEIMRVAMESVEFDVPMLSEGDWSAENWGAMRKFDRKGKRVALDAELPVKTATRRKAA